MTACTIASIRHTLDTTDTYYEKEDEYINNTIPTVMPKFAFDAAVMNSPFRDDIEKEYGKQYFAQKELNRKTFCEANIPLMQQEAKRQTNIRRSWQRRRSNLKGRRLISMVYRSILNMRTEKYGVRLCGHILIFYHSNEKRLEEIWEELITIRNQMGKNLGYANFIPVGTCSRDARIMGKRGGSVPRAGAYGTRTAV